MSLSWVLPYEYDSEEKCLLVTTTPTKLKYISGIYEHEDYDDPEFTERIRYEWEQAGWARPVINKNYTSEEEDIGIPF
jgi:hypothetical protein